MKKSLFHAFLLAALSLVGVAKASAQATKGYTVTAMDPQVEQMCNQVIDLQLDDPDQGNKIFQKVLNKVKKNKEQLVNVGDFFLNKNIYQVAKMCAQQVYKLDPTYIPGLMFSGIVSKAQGFATNNETYFGLAGQKFEEVLALDSTYVPAIRQNVTIYKRINPAAAKVYLDKIAVLDPDDYTVEADLGDIAYDGSDYQQAIEHYGKYFAKAPEDSITDPKAAENYCYSLFSTMDFTNLKTQADKWKAKFPDDIVFQRMDFFADVFNNENDLAAQSISYLSNTKWPEELHTYYDYNVAATYYMNVNDYASAEKYVLQAMKADSTRGDEWYRLATCYSQESKYEEAIGAYNKYFATLPDGPSADMLFSLGMTYLFANNEEGVTPEQKTANIADGAEAFRKAYEKDNTMYKALFRRAQMLITDSSTAEEAPKDAFVELLNATKDVTDDDAVDAWRATAYQYVVFYYYSKQDYATAKTYANEWLEKDPSNETAKQFKQVLDSLQ